MPNSLFRFYGAFSGSRIVENAKKDTALSSHFGLLFKKKGFSLSIESGTDLFTLQGIPVYSEIIYGEAKQKYTLQFLRIPESFLAPRSRHLHSFYNILETGDSTKSAITMTSISSTHAVTDCIKQTLSISYIFMDYISSLRAAVKFVGEKPFNFSLTYSLSTENGKNRLKQKIKFSHTNLFTKYLGMSSNLSHNLVPSEYWRLLLNIRFDLNFFSTYSISPLFTYIIKNGKNKDFSIGLKQHLYLFEKTYGEFTLLFPVISKYYKNTYSIYATLNFLL
jgi:hypothetical protein